MHELSLCNHIIKILTDQALQNKVHQIKKIWIEIGALAGIELDALRFSFPIAAQHSIAENSVLETITLEARAWCNACQHTVTLYRFFDPCMHCGRYDYQITQGKEMRILKMEAE